MFTAPPSWRSGACSRDAAGALSATNALLGAAAYGLMQAWLWRRMRSAVNTSRGPRRVRKSCHAAVAGHAATARALLRRCLRAAVIAPGQGDKAAVTHERRASLFALYLSQCTRHTRNGTRESTGLMLCSRRAAKRAAGALPAPPRARGWCPPFGPTIPVFTPPPRRPRRPPPPRRRPPSAPARSPLRFAQPPLICRYSLYSTPPPRPACFVRVAPAPPMYPVAAAYSRSACLFAPACSSCIDLVHVLLPPPPSPVVARRRRVPRARTARLLARGARRGARAPRAPRSPCQPLPSPPAC